MKQRYQFVILGVLVAVLAAIGYFSYRQNFASADSAPAAKIDEKFAPLNVDNPALRMDILQRFLALEYKGVHRSIFSATLPPPPAPPPSQEPVNVAPALRRSLWMRSISDSSAILAAITGARFSRRAAMATKTSSSPAKATRSSGGSA
jgi:hypothetical protein